MKNAEEIASTLGKNWTFVHKTKDGRVKHSHFRAKQGEYVLGIHLHDNSLVVTVDKPIHDHESAGKVSMIERTITPRIYRRKSEDLELDMKDALAQVVAELHAVIEAFRA